ncbi:MAG: TIM barrel protein [Clostridioides sp.]|nr:TIM barrel protein [Clostridioides sp.]
MRIGISSLINGLDSALDICEEYDIIEHIEIGVDNTDDCNALKGYASRIKSLGLSIGIHLPLEFNPCEKIESIRRDWLCFFWSLYDIIEENFEEVGYYNFHLGHVMTSRLKCDRDAYLCYIKEFLFNLRAVSTVTIENTYSKGGDFSNIGNLSRDFEYIFREAHGVKFDNIYFCYDTGHNLIDRGEYLENLKYKIKTVHLSDNDGVDDLHQGIGKGKLSTKDIFETLNLDPDFLVLEVKEEDLRESIRKIEFYQTIRDKI